MALEPETKAELSKAGARFVSATGGVSPIDKSPMPGPSGNGQQPTQRPMPTLIGRHADTMHALRLLAKDIDEFATWLDQQTLDFIGEIRTRLGIK